jgi:hypothetical protein
MSRAVRSQGHADVPRREANLSDEEEKRARLAFKSIQSQVVKMNVLAVEVKDGKADGQGLAPGHDQRLDREQLPPDVPAREGARGWTIQDIDARSR